MSEQILQPQFEPGEEKDLKRKLEFLRKKPAGDYMEGELPAKTEGERKTEKYNKAEDINPEFEEKVREKEITFAGQFMDIKQSPDGKEIRIKQNISENFGLTAAEKRIKEKREKSLINKNWKSKKSA